MKIGWVLNVNDTAVKDQALKMCFGSRASTATKAQTLQDKYATIEKDRYKVSVVGPYFEVEESDTKVIQIKKVDKVKEQIVKKVSALDGFLLNESEEALTFVIMSKTYDSIVSEFGYESVQG